MADPTLEDRVRLLEMQVETLTHIDDNVAICLPKMASVLAENADFIAKFGPTAYAKLARKPRD